MRKRILLSSLILALSLLVASQSYAAAPHSSAPVAHATAKGLWRAFLSALGIAPRPLPATAQGDNRGGADADGRTKVVPPTSDARGGADPDGK